MRLKPQVEDIKQNDHQAKLPRKQRMNMNEVVLSPCMGERTAVEEWEAVEARFQCAKQVLLDTQQQHCDAAQEFLLARAQMRQMLEATFLGAEASRSVSGI